MTRTQKVQLRQAEIRKQLGAMLDVPPETRSETHETDLAKLTLELRSLEGELAAAILAEPEPVTTETRNDDAEGREIRQLEGRVQFGSYVQAALSQRSVDGAELEWNQHLGMQSHQFPLALLSREVRAKRDGDAEASQATWLDRLLDGTAADRLGISFSPVAPGVAAYPVVTAGGGATQRGRQEAVGESTYSVSVTEIKPGRAAIHGIYSVEDNARLPGLADAIVRDMGSAMAESIDRKVFTGDSSGNENDIAGLSTAGIDETTLTQANKIKADKTLEIFVDLLDGMHAQSLADVRIVAAEGASQLWYKTIAVAAVSNQTIAAFLQENGVTWGMRGNLETNTANNDFGAFMGLARGIEGAARVAVWDAGELIRDPYSNATKGEVMLTLNYLWGFKIPRTSNFKRLKFVT